MSGEATQHNAAAVLAVLAAHNGAIAHRVIAEATGLTPRQRQRALQALIGGGYAERPFFRQWRATEAGRTAHASGAALVLPEQKAAAKAVKDPGRAPLRTRLWRAMRVEAQYGSRWTVRALLKLADGHREADGPSNASKYVRALYRAEYLARFPRNGKQPADGWRYRLVRNTGPEAPALRRPTAAGAAVLFDPNTGDLIDLGLVRPAKPTPDHALEQADE